MKLLLDYPRYRCPSKHGSKYFFRKNDGLQNQYVIYIQDSLDAEPKVFLDPNMMDKDGLVSVDSLNFSENGDWVAYSLADSGSDWRRIKVRNVATGLDSDETLLFCKYTFTSWTHDNKGFFYSVNNITDFIIKTILIYLIVLFDFCFHFSATLNKTILTAQKMINVLIRKCIIIELVHHKMRMSLWLNLLINQRAQCM